MIVLRTSENVVSLPSTSWVTNNIANLCKKFVVKTIKIDAKFNARDFPTKLNMQLKKYHTTEQLNLIGGFQDNQMQLQLLMYKQDRPGPEADLFIQVFQPAVTMSPDDQRHEIENLINSTHLDN